MSTEFYNDHCNQEKMFFLKGEGDTKIDTKAIYLLLFFIIDGKHKHGSIGFLCSSCVVSSHWVPLCQEVVAAAAVVASWLLD